MDALQAAAPEATSRGNIVAKSKAATEAIFTTAGTLNECIEVVAHILQRAEMRPIITSLGYVHAVESDGMMVTSVASFIEKHLSSGGTRTKEVQAALELLVKAMSSKELKDEQKMTEAARRLGVRYGTFRHLLDCREKMDAELEDGVEV
jgi:hypothetical protein